MKNHRPQRINILGVEYQVEYLDRPSDVDLFKRASLWGQTDYWTRTIRIYDNGRPGEDVWRAIFHEILHAVAESLKLKALSDDNNHNELDLLAFGITDVLFRNQWVREVPSDAPPGISLGDEITIETISRPGETVDQALKRLHVSGRKRRLRGERLHLPPVHKTPSSNAIKTHSRQAKPNRSQRPQKNRTK